MLLTNNLKKVGLCMDNNTHKGINQEEFEILVDKNRNGRLIDWKSKKLDNIKLSQSYKRLGYINQYLLVKDCATFLEFKKYHDNTLRLNRANFCKNRLCSICSWRRSLKVFSQVSKIMNEINQNSDKEYLFVTFTMKNCSGENLSNSINDILKAYNKFLRLKSINKINLGSFRALEITHNTNKYSKSYNTYHPHLHCVFCVNKNYFSNNYIKTKEFVHMWKNCLSINYEPICYINKINRSNSNINKAISEIAKYTVKSSDVINVDKKLTDEAVYYLHNALKYRRLIAFNGMFKDLHKKLNLSDNLDDNLINVEEENIDIRNDINYVLVRYCWNIGYNNYTKVEEIEVI